MPLLKRKANPRMQAASRGNGRKSEGPTTERGRSISRFNAVRRWGRSECIRDLLSGLGEDPEVFERVREDLYSALQPGDEFEALVVGDMVEIHCRLRRYIRAEASAMAARRREFIAETEALDARMSTGSLNEIEPFVVPTLGYAGLKDSPPKFFHILELLRSVSVTVQRQGYAPECLLELRAVYGQQVSLRGSALISEYETLRSAGEAAGSSEGDSRRERFLRHLQSEMDWFEVRAESDRRARADLAVQRRDAEMLKTGLDAIKTSLYLDRLERCFERKWNLLRRYRLAAQAPEGEEDDGNQDQAAPGETTPGAAPAAEVAD